MEQVSNSFISEMMNKYFPKKEEQKQENPVEKPEMGAPTGQFAKYINEGYIMPARAFRQAAQDAFQGGFDQLFENVLKAESNTRHTDDKGKLILGPKTSSGDRARGIAQIMPATGKNPGYGIKPLQDDSEEEHRRVGRSLLKAYTDKFDGDYAKGLAAYNWGPGNLTKAIDKHGVNWRDALPKETSNYLKKILGNQNG